MPTRVIRKCEPRFNDASKPVMVTDDNGNFWVEDPPNLARTLPVRSEEAAEHIWDTLVKYVSTQPPPHLRSGATTFPESNRASDRS